QRRYWEHTVRNSRDFERHVDYIHFNPVKHGLVSRVRDWPFSSFHRFVRQGLLPRIGRVTSVSTTQASVSGTSDPDFASLNPGYEQRLPPSRRARLVGELLEHSAQRAGGAHALRERQTQGDALELQLEPFRIAADAAPSTVRRTEQPGRIEPTGVG